MISFSKVLRFGRSWVPIWNRGVRSKVKLNRSVADRGEISSRDRGATFTQKEVYQSTNLARQMDTKDSESLLTSNEALANFLADNDTHVARMDDLANFAQPQTPGERRVSEKMDTDALGLSAPAGPLRQDEDEVVGDLSAGRGEAPSSALFRSNQGSGPAVAVSGDVAFSRKMLNQLTADERRRETSQFRHSEPHMNRKDFRRTAFKVDNLPHEDEVVEKHQDKLVEDHGIYPEQRLDAYMTGDDRIFPEWVQHLGRVVRDRVKFGNIGLTEDDQVLRVNLGKLSYEERLKEWDRLKQARISRNTIDKLLSPTEIRSARLGKRRFFWLQRRRLKRAAMLKNLVLKRPERYETWPTDRIDYSKRVANVCQHIELGLPTYGTWPLNPDRLRKAREARLSATAGTGMFLESAPGQSASSSGRGGGRMNRNVIAAVNEIGRNDPDDEVHARPIKSLSRKRYADRVNAVRQGDQDEHGRNMRRVSAETRRRHRPRASMDEYAVERIIPRMPSVTERGSIASERASSAWPDAYKQGDSFSRSSVKLPGAAR